VRASLLLVQEFAAQVDDARGGGRVVLLTSGGHIAPMAREVAYAVSKGALAIATRTLAEELADRRITVNCVNPGPTDTGWGLAETPRGGCRWPVGCGRRRTPSALCSDDALAPAG
jgi:3-oxoacyl-[acyl-carrier protein] reductase